MASLRSDGVSLVVGTYSSDLSIPASTAADAVGMLYWETGAVADRLTGRGLPLVFRVGASGTNLGSNSASFAAEQLAPRLGRTPSQLRLAIVAARDDYATSVADAAALTARAAGVPIVARINYDLVLPGWPDVMRQLAAAKPDVIILASHIPDGVAFRKAMIAAGLHVGALIGSTMAECDPDFAGELGADAIGVFASDRPTGGFQPTALGPAARATYDRFAAAWAAGQDAPHVTGRIHGDAGLCGPRIRGPVRDRHRRFGRLWLRPRLDLGLVRHFRHVCHLRPGHDAVRRGADRGGHLRVLRGAGRCSPTSCPRSPATRSARTRSPRPRGPPICPRARSRTAPGCGSRATRRRSGRTSARRRSSGSGRPSARTRSSGRPRTRRGRSASCRSGDDHRRRPGSVLGAAAGGRPVVRRGTLPHPSSGRRC